MACLHSPQANSPIYRLCCGLLKSKECIEKSESVRETGKDAAMGRKKIQITRIMDERNRQ
ncbi:hypothetical protein INR49_007821, partial [Caranx melampygus]